MTKIPIRRRRGRTSRMISKRFSHRIGLLVREASHVSARTSQSCHEASADRVAGRRNHDWYSRCGLLGRDARQGTSGYDDINIQAYELGSDFAISTRVPVCPAIFDCDGAALEPTKLAQSCTKLATQCLHVEGVPAPRNPIVGFRCWATVARGEAVLTLSKATNSRRLMSTSRTSGPCSQRQ